MAAYKCTLPDS